MDHTVGRWPTWVRLHYPLTLPRVDIVLRTTHSPSIVTIWIPLLLPLLCVPIGPPRTPCDVTYMLSISVSCLRFNNFIKFRCFYEMYAISGFALDTNVGLQPLRSVLMCPIRRYKLHRRSLTEEVSVRYHFILHRTNIAPRFPEIPFIATALLLIRSTFIYVPTVSQPTRGHMTYRLLISVWCLYYRHYRDHRWVTGTKVFDVFVCLNAQRCLYEHYL